jgi:hypothetical protein
VIDEATPIATVLFNALDFLLRVFGGIALIAFVLAGIFYYFSFGNDKQMQTAKNWIAYSIIAVVIALGALVLVWTIAGFMS